MIKLNAFCNDMSETAFSLIFKNLVYRIYPFETREYMFYGRWNDCIATLRRHLEMKSAVWRDERSASMRFIARACTALNDIAEAERCCGFPYVCFRAGFNCQGF